MSNTAIHTLRNVLIPNGQDTRCFLDEVNETEGQYSPAKTSSFCPLMWDPERLPSSAHLREDLPTKMLEDLAAILGHSYSGQAAMTSFTNRRGRNLTPNDVFMSLQDLCASLAFRFNCEEGAKALSQCLSYLVIDIYYVLTGKKLMYQTGSSSQVISDFAYVVDDGVHILGEAMSPKVFNHFIGELVRQMRDGSSAHVCVESAQTNYDGYNAILAKVRVVSSVSRLLSESSLPSDWVSCERRSAPRPLGNHIQRTPLHDCVYPSDIRKANNVLLADFTLLPSTWWRAGTFHATSYMEYSALYAAGGDPRSP
jgi:hypothetical protein